MHHHGGECVDKELYSRSAEMERLEKELLLRRTCRLVIHTNNQTSLCRPKNGTKKGKTMFFLLLLIEAIQRRLVGRVSLKYDSNLFAFFTGPSLISGFGHEMLVKMILALYQLVD